MSQSLAQIFKEWFAVSSSAARIIAALYDAEGQAVSRYVLMEVASQTTNGVDLSIKIIRQAMEPDSVENLMQRGWRLTATGRRDCENAIVDAAARGIAA